MREQKNVIIWLREKEYPNFELPFKYTDLPSSINSRNVISSEFGGRIDPITNSGKQFHAGLDFALPEGTPVYSVADGTVIRKIEDNFGYGNVLVILHSNDHDYMSFYAHLSEFKVGIGDVVKLGDVVAKSGKTGHRVKGAHLHFEVIKGDEVYRYVENGKERESTALGLIKSLGPQSSSIGLGTTFARINPRLALYNLGNKLLDIYVETKEGGLTIEGDARANNYYGNFRDNEYFDGLDSTGLYSAGISDIARRLQVNENNETGVSNNTDVYYFDNREQIGNDRIYDLDLDGRINLGGNLINNATLTACVVDSSTNQFSETVWKLANGPHDKSGREYMAVRVDDDGNESKSGKNLRIGIGTAPSEEKSVVNAVTIMNFDFAAADEGYCFGMQFGGYGEEVLEKVIGEVEPTVYADSKEGITTLKVRELNEGRSVLAWLTIGEDGKNYIQVRIIGSSGELGQIIEVMAKGEGVESINAGTGYDICSMADGGFAVVWQDPAESANGMSYLKLRRFDELGENVGNAEILKETEDNFLSNNIRINSVGSLGKLVILYNLDEGLESHHLYVIERDEQGDLAERLIVREESHHVPISGEILGFLDDSYVIIYDWHYYLSNDDISSHELRKVRVSFGGEIGEYNLVNEGGFEFRLAGKADGGYIVSWLAEGEGGVQELYAKEYSLADEVAIERYKVGEVENSDSYFFEHEAREIEGGNTIYIWSEIERINGKQISTNYGKLYNAGNVVLRDKFEVNEVENIPMYGIGSSSLGMEGDFTIYWQEVSLDEDSVLTAYMKGISYDQNAIELGANYTLIRHIEREACLKLGSKSADNIILEEGDLPVYGREGSDEFVVAAGENRIRDFTVGEDVISLSAVDTTIDRNRRLKSQREQAKVDLRGSRILAEEVASKLYANVSSGKSGSRVTLYQDNNAILANIDLQSVNSLDLDAEDFRFEASELEMQHLESGIGLRGVDEVSSYVEDNYVKLPEMEVRLQGDFTESEISGLEEVTARLLLSDIYGELVLDREVKDLTSSYNKTEGSLELTGNLTAVNQALKNISFVPKDDVNEALNCYLNVSCNGYVRSATLRINGVAVNDAPILQVYLSNYSMEAHGNATLGVGNMTDIDSPYDAYGLELYVKDGGRFVQLEGFDEVWQNRTVFVNGSMSEEEQLRRQYDWIGGYFSDDGNVVLAIDNPTRVGNYEFLYRGSDGELYSGNESFYLGVFNNTELIDITENPSLAPSVKPTILTAYPSKAPSLMPSSVSITTSPSLFPSLFSTYAPTEIPTSPASAYATSFPSSKPFCYPSSQPTGAILTSSPISGGVSLNSTSNSNSGNKGINLSAAELSGITIGAVFFSILVAVGCYCLCRKKKDSVDKAADKKQGYGAVISEEGKEIDLGAKDNQEEAYEQRAQVAASEEVVLGVDDEHANSESQLEDVEERTWKGYFDSWYSYLLSPDDDEIDQVKEMV